MDIISLFSPAGKETWLCCPVWVHGEQSWGNPKFFGLQLALAASAARWAEGHPCVPWKMQVGEEDTVADLGWVEIMWLLIPRAALAGVGLVSINCGIWTGGDLLDFWGWHCNYSIISIRLVCYVSSKPSREAPSLRPPRSQSRSAQFSSFPCPPLLSWLFKNLRSCCSVPFMNWVWYKNPSSSANMHSCHIEHIF